MPRQKVKKMNRIERNAAYTIKRDHALKGEGVFEWQNQTRGDLHLTKPANDGRRIIPGGGKFMGDSYFRSVPEVRMVCAIQTVEASRNESLLKEKMETDTQEVKPFNEETDMSDEKLIVDQPDKVTTEGTVEQVKKKEETAKPLNEDQPGTPGEKPKDVLLNDAPVDGVEILI